MKRLIYAGVGCISATYIGFLIATIFFCIPVQKDWNPTVPGHCLRAQNLAYSSGAFNVASDIFVVFLPLPTIWSLNTRLSRRLKILTVFSLGITAVAMSITRLAKTPILYKDEADSTWELSNFAVYAMLELDIGLICACLLAFPAFIDRYGPGLMKRLASYSIRRRSTTRKISASSKEGSSSGNGRIFKHCSSDEYAKLAEGTSGTMMHDITPEIADHSNHRAKLEYEDAFQSLQSPQTLASAHIV